MIRWSVRHPVVALVVWLVVIVAIAGISTVASGKPRDVFSLPGQQSTVAQDMLEKLNAQAPATNSVTVVWKPVTGSATDASTRSAVEPALERLAELDGATCVTTPFARNIGSGCSSNANTPLTDVITQKADAELRKATHLTAGELAQVTALLPKLIPLESASPRQLAAIARALPALAHLAEAPRPLLDGLARLTPADLSGLEGLTRQDMEEATAALGSLKAFADLPPATLSALAKADPAALAKIARHLPADASGIAGGMSWLGATLAPVAHDLGITKADEKSYAALVGQLQQAAALDPAQLGKAATALPSLAALARHDKATIDLLGSLQASDLAFLEGLTRQDIVEVTQAFGALARFAQLPDSTLRALATADKRELAAAARKLPSQVTAIEKDWKALQAELARLHAAGEATQTATAQVSSDGSIAYATVTFSGAAPAKGVPDQVLSIVESMRSEQLEVGAQGSSLEGAGAGPDNSAAIGILVAIVILLIAFGSIIAAGLPILVAGTGLAGGLMAVTIAMRFMDVASFAPTLASMIGLGVGIDYALFILNRYRQGLQEGKAPKDAALTSVGTAGKAVLFAGSTVIIALLGMFVLGITFFDGLSVAAAMAVLFVMASALVFLPALLSLLGTRALALRLPWARTLKPFDPDASRWSGYGRLLQRKPLVPVIIALAIIGILAWPARELRTGFTDDGTAAQGSVLRVGFDLMSEGFGPGNAGPFFVAVQTPTDEDFAGLRDAIVALEKTPGVARTLPTSAMLPLVELDKSTFGDGGDVTSVLVIPSTSPQAEETDQLLADIRATTAPALEREHGVKLFVGGTQAVSMDFTSVLNDKLPLFLLIVIGLGFLALMLLFHSLLIPLTAAVTSLLSFLGALGVTVGIFQLGYFDTVLGVTGTGPILPFLPIMMFAILFGLSMDYQVFLASRMQEEWRATGDNRESVRRGLAGSGRVVVIAASIMTSVFLAFVPTPVDAIKLFGVALSSAVIIDAFIVRLVLVPSLMTLFGRANWWMPKWLDRILPTVTLE